MRELGGVFPRGGNLSVPIGISTVEPFKNESEEEEFPTLLFPFLSR